MSSASVTSVEPAAPPQRRFVQTWVIVASTVGGFVLFFVVLSPFAIYGLRQHLIGAKRAEANDVSARLAQAIAKCTSASGGALPPTARPVPPSLASVRGMKYQSAPGDWQDEAYACARFQLATPQYFQYQWVRTSPRRGVVRALADLDGDATPELKVEREVTCEDAATCAIGDPVELPGSL